MILDVVTCSRPEDQAASNWVRSRQTQQSRCPATICGAVGLNRQRNRPDRRLWVVSTNANKCWINLNELVCKSRLLKPSHPKAAAKRAPINLLNSIITIIGGKNGGGKPDFAMGGGNNEKNIKQATEIFISLI